jgi:hypothetical protein
MPLPITSMLNKSIQNLLTYTIAGIWVINGFFCKVLHLVPRHEQIVARILGTPYSRSLTIVIGCAEIAMALWIISRIKTKWNAIAQAIIIATMNTIEFIMAPDLLLWGRWNAIFALLLIIIILYNEFYLNRQPAQPS